MAYSMDLRYRVVEAYEQGEGSMQQLAERFRINVSSVLDWIVRMRETGDVVPDHGGGRQRLIGPAGERILGALLAEQADATLPELCEKLAKRTKLSVSDTTMFRALRRMGISRKKNGSRVRTGPARRGPCP